jgi:hypothetical protein
VVVKEGASQLLSDNQPCPPERAQHADRHQSSTSDLGVVRGPAKRRTVELVDVLLRTEKTLL